MQSLPFHTGRSVPQLGFGLWQVNNAASVTETALRAGYRLVDGTAIYGNEAGQGAGIMSSGVPREDIFVTTKIWNDRQGLDATLRAAGLAENLYSFGFSLTKADLAAMARLDRGKRIGPDPDHFG
jgi:diketogulonate reductase-like aldo/keto reductase